MTPAERKESFETWHASLYVYLDQLRAAVPDPAKLDFSVESLDTIEAWLLKKYPTLDDARADMSGGVNDAGVYIGEVIRKNAGRGKWQLDEKEDSVFFGFPLLVDFRQNGSCSPVSLASASTDRRRGDYLRSVVSHLLAQAPAA